ncbi:hypothetical protein MTR_7g025380 [Medicago truncatula]|uniref:Uncharacterized protein n=1 Tax=Medicago truncatula TaxID=3880 RepID=G7KYX2_MEDTR|nr:hypothetical protein MTR_7g025380 [Medicago truncatula]
MALLEERYCEWPATQKLVLLLTIGSSQVPPKQILGSISSGANFGGQVHTKLCFGFNGPPQVGSGIPSSSSNKHTSCKVLRTFVSKHKEEVLS